MPNRILKESITTSETLDQLTAEEERFFCRLIVVADDYGRMDARPTVVRSKCFPLKINRIKDSAIEKWLQRLADVGLIRFYVVNGQPFLQFVTWPKHQQMRAKRSRYPDPPNEPDTTGNQVLATGNHLLADASNSPRIRISNPNPIRETESDTEYESEPAPPGDPMARVRAMARAVPKPGEPGAPDWPLWEAFAEVLGCPVPTSPSAKRKWSAPIWELHSDGVTADDIAELVSRFDEDNGVPCTPQGVANQLATLRVPKRAKPHRNGRDEPRGFEGLREAFADLNPQNALEGAR